MKENKVIQKGENGKRKLVYEYVIDESGKTVETKLVSKKVVEKDVNRIVSTRNKRYRK